jgi:hypothetical protein
MYRAARAKCFRRMKGEQEWDFHDVEQDTGRMLLQGLTAFCPAEPPIKERMTTAATSTLKQSFDMACLRDRFSTETGLLAKSPPCGSLSPQHRESCESKKSKMLAHERKTFLSRESTKRDAAIYVPGTHHNRGYLWSGASKP